ncbi:MAG: putative colanic acid biosynthesis acetyltransferase [Chthoniobacterales bacterium]
MAEKTHADPYLRPSFSRSDRARRMAWNAAWWLLCRWTPRPLHRWRALVLKAFGARLGPQNYFYPDVKIWAPWLLETGFLVTVGSNAEIYNPGGVTLGHHTIISQDAYLCGATHDYNSPEFTYVMKPIATGPYTWICARAIVLPGVRCGEGSVLGAGSVTSRDMEPWTVYAGNPARAMKQRRHEA